MPLRVFFLVHPKSFQSCPILCNPMGMLPGSPVQGILQARILEWVAVPRRYSWPRLEPYPCVSDSNAVPSSSPNLKWIHTICIFSRHFLMNQAFQLFCFFFSFIFISLRLITLEYCSGFCHRLTWISHGFTCIPHPDPPSHLPLYLIPLGLPSAPGLSTCLMHPAWAGNLFHTWRKTPIQHTNAYIWNLER